MGKLKVFVSSTCYDLSNARSQLRVFLNDMGYDPIMSDHNDILYDPRMHTHTSCINEVGNCDMLILIVGSRFGGKGVTEAVERVNFDILDKDHNLSLVLDAAKDNYSITQLEVLKAIEESIPVFTFIDQQVWHDHELFERNKEKDIIDQITFPSIDKQVTAKYIFNFINFVRHRSRGNNIFTFNNIQDVEEILKKQWANYFQRLLSEQRNKEFEARRIDNLTEQFEDLKVAILSSIGTGSEKEVARGVVQYRRLIDIILSLRINDTNYIKTSTESWDELLKLASIKKVINASNINFKLKENRHRSRTILLKEDGSFFECRLSEEFLHDLSLEWSSFILLTPKVREVIVDTIIDLPARGAMGVIRYHSEKLQDLVNPIEQERTFELTQQSLLDNI